MKKYEAILIPLCIIMTLLIIGNLLVSHFYDFNSSDFISFIFLLCLPLRIFLSRGGDIMGDSILAFLAIVLIIILLIAAIILYFLPTIIAYKKKHSNKTIILLLNLLLGWTFLGWVGSLVWAIMDNNVKNNTDNNKYKDLARLQQLKKDGAITDIEFEIEKNKLLNQ